MNTRNFLASALAAACTAGALAVSGAALAQGSGGGGGSSSTGPGQSTGGDTGAVYPAPTQGVEQNPPATGQGMNPQSSKPKHKKHHKPPVQKPMNDTTNMPGANASSDTKGQ